MMCQVAETLRNIDSNVQYPTDVEFEDSEYETDKYWDRECDESSTELEQQEQTSADSHSLIESSLDSYQP